LKEKEKLHVVDGTNDILFSECKFKSETESKIMKTFEKFGYFELQTPTFEHASVFSEEESNDFYKLIDRNGSVLTLRPDMTTPIARVAATKLREHLPVRASYLANVFRYQDTQKGGRQNEFTQAGIEFLGGDETKTAVKDAEIIAATIKALIAVDIPVVVELGDVNFVRGLLSDADLSDQKLDEISNLMTKKDTLAIEEILLHEGAISGEIKELFIKLPTLFGDSAIIDEFLQKDFLPDTCKKALLNMKEILRILSYYGYEKYVSVDLGMNKNMEYYTGMIFRIFTHNVGFPIAGGGRYDKLIEKFGQKLPATGSAIYINRLLDGLISRINLTPPVIDEKISEIDIKTAIEKAQKLRKEGKIAVIQGE